MFCSASVVLFSDLALVAATLPLRLTFLLICREAEFGAGVAVSGVWTGDSLVPSVSILRFGLCLGLVLIFGGGGSASNADSTEIKVSRFCRRFSGSSLRILSSSSASFIPSRWIFSSCSKRSMDSLAAGASQFMISECR